MYIDVFNKYIMWGILLKECKVLWRFKGGRGYFYLESVDRVY